MKLKRTFLLSFVFLVFGLVLVGCSPKVEDPTGPTLLELKADLALDKTANIDENIELPKYVMSVASSGVYNHTITWASSDSSVIAIGGLNKSATHYVTTVTQAAQVKTVTLTATIVLNNAPGEATKPFTVTIAALPLIDDDTTTTLDAKSATDGTAVEISGTISYVNEKGLFVHDQAGGLYIYLGKTHTYQIGSDVVVSGTKSTYSYSDNYMPQITNNPEPTITVGTNSGYNEMPENLTYAQIGEKTITDLAFFGTILTLRGVVETSTDYNTPYILRDYGASGFVGINKYVVTAATAQLADHVGDYVEIDLIVYDFYQPTTGDQYWRFLAIENTLEVKTPPVLSDADKVAQTKQELSADWANKVVNADITLPDTNAYGVTITWASNHVAISNSGIYTAPQDEDVTVTFIATIVTTSVTDTLTLTMTAKKAVSENELHIIINEVYGGGGNSGSTYKNDFVELYNPTDSAVDLSGWSLQYASGTGTFNAKVALTGSIAAHSYYLIQCAQGSGGTASLPTPDVTCDIAMSSSKAKVALANTATTVVNPTDSQVVDFVGIGEANLYEGTTGTTAAYDNTSSVTRINFMDSNDNRVDFEKTTPTPQNSAN